MVEIFAGNRTGDGRLSGAGQAVEPEDASLVLILSPCFYFLNNVDAGAREAIGSVLVGGGVEERLSSTW